MGIPVVVVASGGLPVTDATATGFGVPMTVATNGYGIPVTLVASGGLACVGVQTLDTTAPTITSSASVSVNENATLAHTLTANETVAWSKVGGADTAKFTLTGAVLSWTSGTKDFEAPDDANTDNAYTVTVRATDTASNTADQTITVTVVNVTGVPIITSATTANNTEGVALAHSLTADQVVTWSIVGGADSARFELSGSTLRWLSNGVKDFEAPNDADTNNAYIVTVRGTSGEGTADQTITVTVVDTGEATPSLSATLDLDFVANTSIIAGASSTSVAPITITRTGTAAWAESVSGIWTNFAANTARRTDKGLLIEEARTNVCLQNRTLTNASWVKTNCTAAKDQVGIDGVASSASRITATAANATCLLTTTIASSARWQTAFIKRLVGTGTIEMTQNGGTLWTAVTATAGWTRVTCPTVTAANPVVGFRIVTSGDSIAVDMVQNENSGTFATSPITTTTATVARPADVVVINTGVAPIASWFTQPQGTLFAEGEPIAATLATPIVLQIDNAGTSLHYVGLPGGTAAAGGTTTAGSAVGTFNGTRAAGVNKAAWAYTVNDMAGSHNGAAVVTDITGAMPTGLTTTRLGGLVAATYWSGYLRRLVYFNTRVPNATLVTLTSATPATITAPAVTGTTHVLQTLTSTTGLWTGSPTGYTYQWYRVT